MKTRDDPFGVGVQPGQFGEMPSRYKPSRGQVLDTVKGIICKDRNATHGEPEDSFRPIAEFWTVYLQNKYKLPIGITSLDVAMMMSLFKHGRQTLNASNPDNYYDAVGYSAIAGSIAIELEGLPKECRPAKGPEVRTFNPQKNAGYQQPCGPGLAVRPMDLPEGGM